MVLDGRIDIYHQGLVLDGRIDIYIYHQGVLLVRSQSEIWRDFQNVKVRIHSIKYMTVTPVIANMEFIGGQMDVVSKYTS